ncbi:MAG: HAD-IC family P-type ATPase [Patescibacteria group bacterium]
MNQDKQSNTPWAQEPQEVFTYLQTSNEGISSAEADKRIEKFGTNIFHSKEKIKVVSIFLKQFASPLIFLLLGAAVLTAVLGKTIDMFVIIFAVLFNAILGFYREYHAENTLDKLVTYIKDRARVIRDGKELEIDSVQLVPGDIVKLSYGTRVPADARIISTSNFRVDEAVLTGESIPVEKETGVVSITSGIADRKNIAHAGTLVVEGYATAIVYATGSATEIGKIANIVANTERAETPIQKGVAKLGWLLFFVTIIIVAGIFSLGTLRGEPILEMLTLSAAVAVGAVPEALPIALTVILAIGAERIASRKGIVRKLAAAETLGSTTLIMTDKTGTLTMADMQLVGIYTQSHILENTEALESKHFSTDQKKILSLALENIDVTIENHEDAPSEWKFHGRPFEINIAKASIEHNVGLEQLKKDVRLVIPFNSTHKFSVAETDTQYIVMGAPDILLRRSKMTKDAYLTTETWIDKVSSEGKRLIGIATLDKKNFSKKISTDDIENIHFMGVMALFDPIRPDVPAAIKKIQSYGIKMVMITGDLKGTALAITRDLKWNVTEEEVLTGSQLHEMTDEELLTIIPSIKIFARVTPEDKLRIGQLYQRLGEVVAMTGDGVNDAPALKAMDIGISLGSGSDVAKSAADMVLLDDNFKTISLSVEEGRKILSNIRKTFVYLMSNSLDAIFVIGGSLIIGLPMPLTALQIIWVNFFTGSLPVLAFAFDEDLDKKHTAKTTGSKLIFTNEVTFITFGIGVMSSLFLFFIYYGLLRFGVDLALTKSLFFVCFASYILVVAYSFRSLYNPLFSYPVFSNAKLNISILFAALLLIGTVTIPAAREIFGLVAIPLVWIWFIAAWLILNVLLVEGAKYFIRK